MGLSDARPRGHFGPPRHLTGGSSPPVSKIKRQRRHQPRWVNSEEGMAGTSPSRTHAQDSGCPRGHPEAAKGTAPEGRHPQPGHGVVGRAGGLGRPG